MDPHQRMIVVKAIIDIQSGRDQYRKRREVTLEELDAMADYFWPWSDLKDLTARICTNLTCSLSDIARRTAVRFAARREASWEA